MASLLMYLCLSCYTLCLSCQAYELQESEFGFVNRSAIVTFSENLTAVNLPLHTATTNNEFAFSSMGGQSKSRQRRGADDSPDDLLDEERQRNSPSQVFAYKKGDFNLGGMFAVRIPDHKDTNPCSKVLKLTGLRIESMLYAIDIINNSTDILPDIKLGFEIRDDCSNKNRALRVIKENEFIQ